MADHALYGAPNTGTLTLRALGRRPSHPAFVWDGGRLTYRDTLAMIGRMQAVFVASGLGRGACVGVLAGNRADSWCAMSAAQALGVAMTPLHTMGSLEDHRFQLADAGVDALVVDATAFAERGAALADDVPITFTLGPAPFGTDLLAAMDEIGPVEPVADAHPEDIAMINYTGGTTGRSKGAMRRQASAAASHRAILADFELPTEPRYLAVAPISHVAGTKVLPTLLRGGTVHLMQGFDPDRVATTILRERINMTLLVPTMVYSLLDHVDDMTALASLELLLYGASPMSPTRLREGLERIGPVFSQLYGQTECYPVAVLPRSDHDPDRPDLFSACGFPVSSCAVSLRDDEDQEVPVGEAGEICVRGAHVMEEYWKQPDQTASALAGGWLRTSDIARCDDEGRLYIVDRKKDMIISGGFNVYPKEVEDTLTGHPDVAQAAVIGVPDEKWGEAVTAVVVGRAGSTPDPDALIDYVKQRKGSVHAPKSVQFVDELPVTAVGKVDKKSLRAPHWAETDRAVG